MESTLQDFRYAARRLLRAPAFTITAVLTVAIGIGAVTAVFSVVDGVLLKSLPFPAAERLYWVEDHGTAPLGLYDMAKSDQGSIEGTAAYENSSVVLSGLGPAEWVQAPIVTAELFPLLGARPYLGRLIETDEDRAGSAPVVVLSHAFWIKRFGGDSAAVGRTIRLDATDYRVVGVSSSSLQVPESADMWRNLGPQISGPHVKGRAWWILARLRPGVTPIRAESELRRAARTEAAAFPMVYPDGIGVQPLQGFLVGEFRTGLWILLGAVGLLLLTAATNVASLLVARIANRDRELSVRTALGARRSRLASMVLAEALLVSLAGGGGGLFLADAGFKSLLLFVGTQLPQIVDIRISSLVLVFATLVSLATGVAAGLVPAIQAGRRDPVDGIKGYAQQGGRVRQRPGDTLVVAQVALTVVLLSGAGLLGHSLWRLVTLDPGYRSKDVVSAEMVLPERRYPTAASREAYVTRALERLKALPGVTSAAVSTGIPGRRSSEISFNIANPAHPDVRVLTAITVASPDYLGVLGIPLKRGRWPTDQSAAVISEKGARVYFPGEDPLGKVLTDVGGPDLTIVGVAGDTRQLGLTQEPPAQLYLPLGPDPSAFPCFAIRTTGPTPAMVAPVRAALEELDPGTPVYDVAPLSTMVAQSLATERSYAIALAVFAFAALAVAAIGMYGLIATGVARRTREIGIRIALGAERETVMGLVLRRGVVLTGLGLAIGLAGSALGTRVLKSMLFQVGAGDPMVLAAVAAVLFAATLAASYFPARRAAAVDPVVALRTE